MTQYNQNNILFFFPNFTLIIILFSLFINIFLCLPLSLSLTRTNKITSKSLENLQLIYDWGCNGSYTSSLWTLNDDYTLYNDEGYEGTWEIIDNQVILKIPHATYTGMLTGTMIYGSMSSGDLTGCWIMLGVPTLDIALGIELSVSPLTGDAPLEILCEIQAVGGVTPYQYAWNFEGDQIITTSKNTTSYTYTDPGAYTITAAVIDNNEDIEYTQVTISVNEAQLVVPESSVLIQGPTYVTVNNAETFESYLKSSDITDIYYTWNFGDNSDEVSSLETSVNHTYTTSGAYTITVLAQNDEFAALASHKLFVLPASNLISITLTSDKTQGTKPFEVYFTSTAQGGTEPYTYYWDFGSLSIISGLDNTPSYTFNEAGTYEVTAAVIDFWGDIDFETLTITVGE